MVELNQVNGFVLDDKILQVCEWVCFGMDLMLGVANFSFDSCLRAIVNRSIPQYMDWNMDQLENA
jgi:hypothetical protein